MMTAAKIVETVPWIDAKYYASTQTMDEARHTEVFAKYLRTKLGDATQNQRARATTREVWERLGTTGEAVLPFMLQAAEQMKMNLAGGFARNFFAKLVPNVRKLGLLDANDGWLREKWGERGLLEFEFADDTGSDYEAYDEVAKDRAAASVSAEAGAEADS